MKGKDTAPIGDTFESFLESEGIREEVYSAAIKRVISWELEEARKATDLTKTAMAEAMQTSRSQVERVLDPENVAVSWMSSAGRRLRWESASRWNSWTRPDFRPGNRAGNQDAPHSITIFGVPRCGPATLDQTLAAISR